MRNKVKVILTTAIAMAFSVNAYAAISFSDVPEKHWAYDAVNKLAKAGIIDGNGDGSYRGDNNLTRYEMAIIVAKAVDKYEKADDNTKQVIDKLSAEFAKELNTMGVRVSKVEAKTNTWVSGETRFRYMGNDPKAGGRELRGSDKFDFRQRVKFQGIINEDISWVARAQATGKAGNYNNGNDGSNASFDMFAVTAKDVIGLDKVRIGRFPFDPFTHGLFGKPIGVDGIRVDETIGKIFFTGSVNNVKSLAAADQGTGTANSGNANTLTTAQISGKAGDNLGWKVGYYWSDVPGTSTAEGTGSMNTNKGSFTQSDGWTVGIDAKVGDYLLIADYASTSLKGASNLPNSPKGWAVELTNATKSPTSFYGQKNLVDSKVKGQFGWSVSYRSIDAGAVPSGVGGFDAQAMSYGTDPYSTAAKGTDNIKGLFVALQSTVSKNVIWTIEGQDLKIKNRNLTGLSSDDLGKTYMTKLEFFY